MIKKLLSVMMLVAVAFMAVSCGNDQEKKTQEISQALSTQDFGKVSELCDELYDQLPTCSMKTLGDLTVSYIALAAVGMTENDEDAAVDAMRRAVGCYDEAMNKDTSAAQNMWTRMAAEKNDSGFSIDPTEVINMFRVSLASYDTTYDTEVAPFAGVDSITAGEVVAFEETTAASEN